MSFGSKPPPITYWTIVGAVMLGTLLAHMIELIAGAAIASIQLQYATYQMQQAADQNQRAIHAARDAALRQQENLQKQIQAQRLAAQQAEQAKKDAAARREAAWKAFYTRPPACDNNPIDNATFTQRANDHIRARREFDERYTP